jgi:hypothetical protein
MQTSSLNHESSIQPSKQDSIIYGKMLDSNEIPGATNPAQLSNRQQHVVYRETLEPVKSQKQETKLEQLQTFLRSATDRTT